MKEFLERQYPNYALWAPFVMAIGVALYFTLPAEPSVQYPFIISALCALDFILLFRIRFKMNLILCTILSAALLFGFGFFYSCGHTRLVKTETISSDIRSGTVTGVVKSIDYLPDRARIFITDAKLTSDYYPEQTFPPINVRMSVGQEIDVPKIGSTITAKGSLFKPAAADIPGGFDFAEWSYFKGIGATGYITEIINTVPAPNTKQTVANIRDYIHQHVVRGAQGHAAMLSDSLILGYKNAIPRQENDFIKSAGISHVFSISGYHMTMIGGWIFALFYLLLRMFSPLSRRIPVGKIAIIPTSAALCFYLILSGSGVATARAFVMAVISFIALAFNRNLFSLRSAAMVFGILILINPHNLIEAGFQLSFAAIFGILYYFNGRKFSYKTRLQKLRNGIVGIFMTTMIATIFTAPFIAYHFQSLPLYTIIGNMLCIPMFSLLIMPLVLIGTITAMFGFYFPLNMAAHVYELVLKTTEFIHNLPLAQISIWHIPGYAFGLMAMGMTFVVLLINKNNKFPTTKFCFAGIAIGLSLMFIAMRPRPIFYASLDHGLVAFMTDDGKLRFNKGSSSEHQMTFNSWERFNNQSPNDERKAIYYGFEGERFSVECKGGLCFYETPNWNLAYATKMVSLVKNFTKVCDYTNFMVSVLEINAPGCDVKILNGGFVIYKSGRIKYVTSERIWHK